MVCSLTGIGDRSPVGGLWSEMGSQFNGVKKGAWSEEEDEKLRAYILRYGHWNWRLVPKYAGLARCGKSCRLRWVNYLKPGVKRGSFSQHEQDLIVELHAQLGNKWSTIAAKLPGRSDNEIKNFWHTRIEKRSKQRQYPPAAKVTNTHGASNAQLLLEEEKPSQSITFCKTTQNELVSFDSPIQLQDSTKSSDSSVEKPEVDFWTDIVMENDTANSQMNCWSPILQEEEFLYSKFHHNELSSSESSDYFVHEVPVHGDLWSESFVSYTSNSQIENCYMEGLYDPCLEYFDYGMDLFS
ncbi:hypothetical protein BUALT_Bualt03G0202300 [Buddleja alternifolia]|uniref:Uncharacterized protein n=1 Tax=Buddleja alternifolia TaxID=168488 RepID=A0AAV6XXH7_9LAMI|nr:hypothetical protein BUALT_Bualt03G0202300 [Buddleja alternifolia]